MLCFAILCCMMLLCSYKAFGHIEFAVAVSSHHPSWFLCVFYAACCIGFGCKCSKLFFFIRRQAGILAALLELNGSGCCQGEMLFTVVYCCCFNFFLFLVSIQSVQFSGFLWHLLQEENSKHSLLYLLPNYWQTE